MDYRIEKFPSKMTVGDPGGRFNLQPCVFQWLERIAGTPKHRRLEIEPIPEGGPLFLLKNKTILKLPEITLQPPSIHPLF